MSKLTRTRLVAACAAVTLLSACATVGPDYTAPAVPAPDSFAMAGDAAPAGVALSPDAREAGPWWQAFGSPALDATIRQALADSPSVAEAAATLERAQAELAAARGAGGVQAAGSAGAQRQRINTQAFGLAGFPSPTIDLYSVGATVSYDLDLFGGQRRAEESAAAAAEAQARRADAAYLALSGNVALQAVKIAALRAQLATVESIVAADREQIEMIRRAEAAGGAASSQATAGQAQLAQDEALAPPLRRDLAAARHQLALLVGKTPGEWTAPDFDLAAFRAPATIPASLPSQLARRRPDILAAEAALHAATARIGVATADLYPDIRLGVGLTQSSLRPENLFSANSSGWNIGPSVSIPLFSRAGTARRDAAVAEADASLARYKATVLRAFAEVADALTALAHDQEEAQALARAAATREAALADARKAYDLGGGALIAIVDAGRQLSQVRRQQVQAQGRVLEDVVTLHTATAANWRG